MRIVDAYRDNGKDFAVSVDEKLTVFFQLERVTRESLRFQNAEMIRIRKGPATNSNFCVSYETIES